MNKTSRTGQERANPKSGLLWPPLIRGVLVSRYKRFLADIKLDSGPLVTAHCPNSGSMRECCTPGRPVYLSTHDNPRRKLRYTWELIEMPTAMVGVNTLIPNRLVFQAADQSLVPELQGYTSVRAEVAINHRTRLDLKLAHPDRPDCFIEVKNCTLVTEGRASFPDARTTRGQKHLRELISLHRQGCRAVIFFVIQRTDAIRFTTADVIDPEYGRLLRQAAEQGVEVLVYDVLLDTSTIALNQKIPIEL